MTDALPTAVVDSTAARIKIDPKIFELEAILTTSYHYIDDFFVFLTHDKKTGAITVALTSKKKIPASKLKEKAFGFNNILLAESLRLRINRQNKKFREELLEKAIAAALSPPRDQHAPGPGSAPESGKRLDTMELDEELKRIIEKVKDMDYRDDPLGIAVPVASAEKKQKRGPAKKKN